MFVYLGWCMIDCSFVATLDKKKNEVVITKTKLGQLQWKRVAIADELVQVEVVEDDITSKKKGWAMEFEFMSSHGLFRMRVSDSLVVGDDNRKVLEKTATDIMKFMSIKANPFRDKK
ncbi:hypothetical protein HK101_008760 [Irineochytrium annulatum]|nr:hypothetical protein HK101_008760 [Irineochytrium annulatum]